MRGLGLPDAFPAADLGIIKALAPINKNNSGNNNNNQRKLTSKEILATAEAWRPWRAYAAIYLWHSLALTT